jgi:hypothetical protein
MIDRNGAPRHLTGCRCGERKQIAMIAAAYGMICFDIARLQAALRLMRAAAVVHQHKKELVRCARQVLLAVFVLLLVWSATQYEEGAMTA